MAEYEGFEGTGWQKKIDVKDFIQSNFKTYSGDGVFLQDPTDRTQKLWALCCNLLEEENKKGGVLDVDT
jgi:formate C-acetyltransferase